MATSENLEDVMNLDRHSNGRRRWCRKRGLRRRAPFERQPSTKPATTVSGTAVRGGSRRSGITTDSVRHGWARRQTMKRRVGLLIAVLALGPLTACSHTIPMKPAFVGPTAATQVPVVVGVYYRPDFSQREDKIWRMGDRWDFPLGQASVLVLDGAWKALFEGYTPVSATPPLSAGEPRVAAVIEPSIEAFDFGLPFLKSGTYTAEITYRFKLYAPTGQRLPRGQ